MSIYIAGNKLFLQQYSQLEYSLIYSQNAAGYITGYATAVHVDMVWSEKKMLKSAA